MYFSKPPYPVYLDHTAIFSPKISKNLAAHLTSLFWFGAILHGCGISLSFCLSLQPQWLPAASFYLVEPFEGCHYGIRQITSSFGHNPPQIFICIETENQSLYFTGSKIIINFVSKFSFSFQNLRK